MIAEPGESNEGGLHGLTFSPDGRRLFVTYLSLPKTSDIGFDWNLVEYRSVGFRVG